MQIFPLRISPLIIFALLLNLAEEFLVCYTIWASCIHIQIWTIFNCTFSFCLSISFSYRETFCLLSPNPSANDMWCACLTTHLIHLHVSALKISFGKREEWEKNRKLWNWRSFAYIIHYSAHIWKLWLPHSHSLQFRQAFRVLLNKRGNKWEWIDEEGAKRGKNCGASKTWTWGETLDSR